MTITLDVVIKALKDVYRKTEADPYIIKPIAAALYKVWRNVDIQEEPREGSMKEDINGFQGRKEEKARR